MFWTRTGFLFPATWGRGPQCNAFIVFPLLMSGLYLFVPSLFPLGVSVVALREVDYIAHSDSISCIDSQRGAA